MLERDVRFLDSRIALLIQNRMALDEVQRKNMKEGKFWGEGSGEIGCGGGERMNGSLSIYNLSFLLK